MQTTRGRSQSANDNGVGRVIGRTNRRENSTDTVDLETNRTGHEELRIENEGERVEVEPAENNRNDNEEANNCRQTENANGVAVVPDKTPTPPQKPEFSYKRSFTPKSPTQKLRHGEVGFDREELQQFGSLESALAQLPTLKNPVHEIWHKNSFTFFAMHYPRNWDEQYRAMRPAFRLVSRWLTDEVYQTFWSSLRFGYLQKFQPSGSSRFLIKRASLSASPKMLLADELAAIGETHRFHFVTVQHAWVRTRAGDTTNLESRMDLHRDFLPLATESSAPPAPRKSFVSSFSWPLILAKKWRTFPSKSAGSSPKAGTLALSQAWSRISKTVKPFITNWASRGSTLCSAAVFSFSTSPPP